MGRDPTPFVMGNTKKLKRATRDRMESYTLFTHRSELEARNNNLARRRLKVWHNREKTIDSL